MAVRSLEQGPVLVLSVSSRPRAAGACGSMSGAGNSVGVPVPRLVSESILVHSITPDTGCRTNGGILTWMPRAPEETSAAPGQRTVRSRGRGLWRPLLQLPRNLCQQQRPVCLQQGPQRGYCVLPVIALFPLLCRNSDGHANAQNATANMVTSAAVQDWVSAAECAGPLQKDCDQLQQAPGYGSPPWMGQCCVQC